AHARATADPATTPHPVQFATQQLLIGLAFVALALVATALLYWAPAGPAPRHSLARLGAAVVLPGLVAVQALTLAVPYYPRVPRDTFYPTTDVHSFLAANLGHERFAGTRTDSTEGAMIMGTDAAKRLRALTGHGFVDRTFAALVRGVPDDPIPYPTYINFAATEEVARSPILDALGTRYFITSPRDPVFGTARPAGGDGTSAVLQPGQPIRLPVPGDGPVRAVGVTPLAALDAATYPDSWISVTVRDAAGATVATAKRLTTGLTAGTPFLVPVAADRVPAGTRLTVELTPHLQQPLRVAATAGTPAVSSVAGADDGLSLAFAGSAVVYERLTAQPRVRWASKAVVQPSQSARVRLLASGSVAADEVVLNAPGAAAGGQPASVRIDQDGTDGVGATVTAQGAGYLVVADADQVGWSATVDGRPAPLVPADQGVVAVPVPAGTHTVALHYTAPYGNAGTWISVLAVVALMVAAAGDRWLLSRRAAPASGDLND
ncbi:MAG TPA: YfhO family protein, partial [Rugosimonospora sp.]|nr:YfhO family protein [Rugosimonospora sp.]